MNSGVSFVKYYSQEDPGSCGYCKRSDGSERHGMWAFTMTVNDYQDLIDRGWRRSGLYLYKPIMHETCCPMYTIRCCATQFRPSRSQKRILKRVNRFLISGEKAKQNPSSHLGGNSNQMEMCHASEASMRMKDNNEAQVIQQLKVANADNPSIVVKQIPTKSDEESNPKPISLSRFSAEKPSLKAKQLRINRKFEKLNQKGLSQEDISKQMIGKKKQPVVKNLEDYIDSMLSPTQKHKLEIRLVRSNPRSSEFNETYEAGFNLFVRYQVAVHKDPPGKTTKLSYERFLVNSPLQAHFSLHAALFAKYQLAVHNEPIEDNDEATFRQFLVDTPLQATGRYGSFHQQYWLDGALIGVGVIDVLPRCVSSVYYFYDPDYSFLCLGTYGALRELHLVRTLIKSCPELAFYYMGYYIRSCPKMRYKAAFSPSYLLCPEVYTWHPVKTSLAKLDDCSGSRLNEDPEAADSNDNWDIKNIMVLHSELCLKVSQLSLRRSMKDTIKEYSTLVGKTCSKRMVYCLGSDVSE